MSVGGLHSLHDPLWIDTASWLAGLVRQDDLLLAPGEFLEIFPGTIALHVRKRMLCDAEITHYVLHKGMLDRVDPEFLREATLAIPVFANEVFVVFSRRGARLPDHRAHHLSLFNEFLASLRRQPPPSYKTGIVVTTYNRPWALRRTLASLVRQRREIVVVDDGSTPLEQIQNGRIARAHRTAFVQYPLNLGLANALNIGIGHWLAHPDVEWISAFNDDVEVADDMFDVLEVILRRARYHHTDTLYTGYLDNRHPTREDVSIAGRPAHLVRSCPAKHLHAHRSYWMSVLPIPTAYLGAPKRTGGVFAGQGSDADWWIGSWAPRAAPKRGGHVVVIPNLVSTFAADAASSTWGNEN